MITPTYIITLASAHRRREFQRQQAESLGFEPVWHPAVGIQDISDEFFQAHAFRWRRPLKKTEVGCFLSHLSLWKLIQASGQPGVVLEDDAMLGPHWVADIRALSQLQDVDYVCLETWKNKILSSELTAGHLKLRRLHLNSAGSAGYMLWPSGAARLIAQYEAIGPGLADGFINNIDDWRAWQLVPANVIQMCVAPLYGMEPPEEPGSLIASAASPAADQLPWGLHMQMKIRRLLGELRKAKINLGVLAGRSRLHVPFQSQPFQGE